MDFFLSNFVAEMLLMTAVHLLSIANGVNAQYAAGFSALSWFLLRLYHYLNVAMDTLPTKAFVIHLYTAVSIIFASGFLLL